MNLPIIALDIGLKRIGVAYSPNATIVTPLNAVIRKNRNQASLEVKKIISEYSAKSVVVGIPMHGESYEEMKLRIEHFMKLVDFQGDLYYQDESDSSIEAKELMKGVSKQKRDGRIDSLAAQIILQRYLKI